MLNKKRIVAANDAGQQNESYPSRPLEYKVDALLEQVASLLEKAEELPYEHLPPKLPESEPQPASCPNQSPDGQIHSDISWAPPELPESAPQTASCPAKAPDWQEIYNDIGWAPPDLPPSEPQIDSGFGQDTSGQEGSSEGRVPPQEQPGIPQPAQSTVPPTTPASDTKVKPSLPFRLGRFILNTAFYLVLIASLLMSVLVAGQNGKPRNWFGFSGFAVLTSSMHSVLPQGSFLVTKGVDPALLQIGDDITFFQSNEVIVTHRIIEIIENYNNLDLRGFKTRGVDNTAPDTEIIPSVNVIGKVVFHIEKLGALLLNLRDNLWPVVIFVVMLLLLSFCLKVYQEEKNKERLAAEAQDSGDLSLE